MTSTSRFGLYVLVVGVLCVGLAASGDAEGKSIKSSGRSSGPQSLGARKRLPVRPTGARTAGRATPQTKASACSTCSVGKPKVARRRTVAAARCHPKGYVDPKISRDLKAAIGKMRRYGIKPVITSAWRSSSEQAQLHRCSLSRRCRRAHPGLYYAMPPGQSLHEAAFAVDISGVAVGPRGAKRLTPRGRRIVLIMRQHGFKWPYGLRDPAHFEADPRKYGYRSVRQAIRKSHTVCDVRLASNTIRSRGAGSAKTTGTADRPAGVRKLTTNRQPGPPIGRAARSSR
jgi:hypothetical protein